MSKLYEIIESLCKDKGINVTSMCKATGVSRSSLTDLKKGRSSELSTATLKKIAEYFNIPVDVLIVPNDNTKANNSYSKGKLTDLFACDESLANSVYEIASQNSEDIEQPTNRQQRRASDNSNLAFALFGTADIDEDVLNDVRKYAEIARRMREEQKKEG